MSRLFHPNIILHPLAKSLGLAALLVGLSGAANANSAQAIAPAMVPPTAQNAAIAGDYKRNALDAADLCAAAIDIAERDYGMPNKMLRAISLGESGRWMEEEGRSVSWPWTVTNGGGGQYFPTKQAAIAHVRLLQARGERNIDVGCMQINLRAHPDAFESLTEAFDPETNVAYSADFLDRLRTREGSWEKAVGYYHSATPELNKRYRDKISGLQAKLLRSPEPQPRTQLATLARPQRPVTVARLTVPPANASPFFLSMVNRAPGVTTARSSEAASSGAASQASILSGRPAAPGQIMGRGLADYRAGALGRNSQTPLGLARIVANQ